MAIRTYVERLSNWRDGVFRWRYDAGVAQMLALTLGMACITGLFAQIRIPLWFTPVPITGQVFAVLLAGVLLGGRYGASSQLLYLALGACGIPWFQGWQGGLAYLTQGLTLGYFIGFVLAGLLVGSLTDKYVALRGYRGQLVVMIAGVVIILLSGTLYLSTILHIRFFDAMKLGFVPFIPLDLAKAAAVAAVSTALLPKNSYSGPDNPGGRGGL